MNSANQNLQAVKNRKALITKEYNEAKEKLETKYAHDMTILDKEEKEWLEQFDEIPVDDIYKNETKKYRKKPLIVEAYVATKEEYIKTLEGTMKANIGDYVITGVKGEKYPCKPDVFHETYDEVKMIDPNLDIPNNSEYWPEIIEKHKDYRKCMIELNLLITQGMTEYLKTISDSDKFTLRYEDTGIIKLDCEGDLFDLVQIGDFCDLFNLGLIINNRTLVENHLKDTTEIRTRFLFTTGKIPKEKDILD